MASLWMVRLCFRPLCFRVYLAPGWMSTPCLIHCTSPESRLTSTSRVASLYSSATTGVIFLANNTCCSKNEFTIQSMFWVLFYDFTACIISLLILHNSTKTKLHPDKAKYEIDQRKSAKLHCKFKQREQAKSSEEPCPLQRHIPQNH